MTVVPDPSASPATERFFDRNLRVLGRRTKSELIEMALRPFEALPRARPCIGDLRQVRRFVAAVSQHYFDNPYHNFRHAVDTTNAMAWFLSRPRLGRWVPGLYQAVLLVAALVHDMEHPGTDNQWEIKNRSALARKYDDRAVLENRSLDGALRLMEQPHLDIFRHLKSADQAEARRVLAETVLATDFSIHGAFLEELRRFLEQGPRRFETRAEQLMLARTLIKAADIANTAKDFEEARLWGRRVMREYWAQGELEKAHRLPVGPLNDPDRVDFYSAQSQFIEQQVTPLFRLLVRLDPSVQEALDALMENRGSYDRLGARAAPRGASGEWNDAPQKHAGSPGS